MVPAVPVLSGAWQIDIQAVAVKSASPHHAFGRADGDYA